MNLIDKLKKSSIAVYRTFNRFPLTILFFATFAAITIYRMEIGYEKIQDINEILDRISAVIILGIPFTLSVNLFLERFWKNDNILVRIGYYFIEILLLTLYYFYLFPNTEMVHVVRLLLIGFTLTLSFLFIPYLFKKENFEIYVTKIITKFITSALFTIVLALGLSATLFAIKSLLYNDMDGKYFVYIWILAWYIFAPINFLYGLPKSYDTFSVDDFNKVFKVLLLYIILPIVCIYTVVLYIYFGKIVVTEVWPKGIVSYLVLSYTATGIASIFLISPFRENNKWVKMFTVVFTKAIFPLLAMMFMSISIRIGEFGFTENRYFILVIGIWATLAMIFLNINKGRNNIILPISLALIAFLSVCGPWNAFNISKMSQSQRFYDILAKYNMIQNGKVVNNNSNIKITDKKEVSNILQYFDRSHKLNELKYLPNDFKLSKMKDVFGFTEVNSYERRYFNYRRTEEEPLVIKGYNILFSCKTYNYGKEKNVIFEKEIDSQYGNIKVLIDDKHKMSLLHDGTEIYSYDILNFTKELYKKYSHNRNKESIVSKDLVLVDGNDKVEVMFIFKSINGTVNSDDEEIEIEFTEADVFVKIK